MTNGSTMCLKSSFSNKLLLLLLFPLFALLAGCPIYDPPLKGKEILISNQTDDYIFVTDSLNTTESLRLYDTFLVNDKLYISAEGNYIPKFTAWTYLFPDIRYEKMKKEHRDHLNFYFIRKANQNKPMQEIASNKLYDSVYLNISELKKDTINHIFYYGDSIVVTYKFDMETPRGAIKK